MKYRITVTRCYRTEDWKAVPEVKKRWLWLLLPNGFVATCTSRPEAIREAKCAVNRHRQELKNSYPDKQRITV